MPAHEAPDAPGAADPHDLARFLAAQARNYPDALAELRAGRKLSHWMWYVFPQAEGLGNSSMARYYGIRSPAEARAYLQHPVLGSRRARRRCSSIRSGAHCRSWAARTISSCVPA